MVMVRGEQPLSMVPREVQGVLYPGWLARSVDRNVLGSRIRGLTTNRSGEGWASALRVEQREMTRQNENLWRTHRLESGGMTGPQPWTCEGRGRPSFRTEISDLLT